MNSDYVEAEFYCVGEMDYITADSVYQAVLDWYESCYDDSDGRFPIDSEVEVQGYNREVISQSSKCPSYWLEYISDNLDENYGCEETWGEYKPSEEAMVHWEKFVNCVLKEYPVSRLKEVGKPFRVNIKEVLGE